jgi:hypothetical protein
MKQRSFAVLKKQEARRRMAALRELKNGTRTAAELQRRASLVGNGAKWRITNLPQVMKAMSRWAKPD